MRLAQIVLLVALIAGMFLVLAFGFGSRDTTSIGDVALTTSAGMDCGSDCGMEKAAAGSCGSGCGDCSDEPVLAAFVDFSADGEYELTGSKLVNTGNSLDVFGEDGTKIGAFNIDESGKMVPAASQPNGNVVKSGYSGPPGDTYSMYRVYPANYKIGDKTSPLMAIDHNGGNVSVTPSEAISRKNAKSFAGTTGGGGSVAGSSGGSCGTSGGGG